MRRNKQPARKASGSEGRIRAGLIIRLRDVLIRAVKQRANTDHQRFRAKIICAELNGQHQDYHETGNSIHLLNGFVTATRAGVPVPEWVVHAMAAAIEKVLASQGKITLDRSLGLTPKKGGRTKWTELEQHLEDARRKWLFEQQLKKGLPLKSDKTGAPNAVRAVAAILGHAEANDDVLLQTYHKRLKKHSSRLSR